LPTTRFSPEFNVFHPLVYAPDYQRTSTTTDLLEWWQRRGQGVCTLVGFGGTGKTATIDYFLRAAGILESPVSPDIPRAPAAAFVFSLAESTVNEFFLELHRWTSDRSVAEVDQDQLFRKLADAGRRCLPNRALIVLDGLEVLQSDGRGSDGVGRILDYRLRNLLARSAYGAFPGISFLTAGRLALTDIEIQRFPHYVRIAATGMDPSAAVSLLRARGATASDAELGRIAESHGYNALALDLIGHVLREGGRTAEFLKPTALEEEPPDRGEQASKRLRRRVRDLVGSQKRMLGQREPTDLSVRLLDLLSMFRSTVPRDVILRLARESRAIPLAEKASGAIGQALDLLCAVGLVKKSGSRENGARYGPHELVRDALYAEIPDEQRLEWHAVFASAFREIAVEESSHDPNHPWTTVALDSMEETVYHEVRGDNPGKAFETYWRELGNFAHLGNVLSEFSLGERICRMLNLGAPPDTPADYLRRDNASLLLSDWALYLAELGELASAKQAHSTAYRLALNDSSLTIAATNVGNVCLDDGALADALQWAEFGETRANALLQLSEGIPTQESMRGIEENLCLAAQATARMGEPSVSRDLFDKLSAIERAAISALQGYNAVSVFPLSAPTQPPPPESRLHGKQWCEHLLLCGMFAQAAEVTEERLQIFLERYGEETTSITLRETLARSLIALGKLELADSQTDAILEWAHRRESLPRKAVALALRAATALARGDLDLAYVSATDGLAIARDVGRGLLHIDLLVLLSQIDLMEGRPDDALHRAGTALFGQRDLGPGEPLYGAPALREDEVWAPDGKCRAGIFPPLESGRPMLLAATHLKCRYRLGEARARRTLGEALLLQIANHSRRQSFEWDQIDAETRTAIQKGRSEITQSLEILKETVFPDHRTSHPEVLDAERRLAALDAGELTRHDIEPRSITDVSAEASRPTRILVSYSRRDSKFADELADGLDRLFHNVWIDRRWVHIGESFVSAINQALRDVTDFVLIFSVSATKSRWVENELNAALALRNNRGQPTIHPVVIDDSPLPPLLADVNALVATELGIVQTIERLGVAIRH